MKARSRFASRIGVASRNGAFTLVELLVVISIIGILMGLLIPAIQSAKENSRRISCNNNQRNLALAHLQYHSANRFFVGYVSGVGSDYKPASWAVSLFPYIDRLDLWIQWSRTNVPNTYPDGTPFPNGSQLMTDSHPEAYIELFICPSDPPPDTNLSYWSYAVNGGWADANNINEQQCSGVFFNHFRRYGPDPLQPLLLIHMNPMDPKTSVVMTLDYLGAHDGSSNTLMLTENLQQDATVATACTFPQIGTWRNIYPFPFDYLPTKPWTDVDYPHADARINRCVFWHSADNPVWRINGDVTFRALDINHARPSSYHPGGVVAAMCDGHTRFINQSIDYTALKQLMTSFGDQAFALGIDPDNTPYNDAAF